MRRVIGGAANNNSAAVFTIAELNGAHRHIMHCAYGNAEDETCENPIDKCPVLIELANKGKP
jgi:hypothetical protein